MTGLPALLRIELRTSWATVLLLPTLISAVLLVVASEIKDLFPTHDDRVAYAHSVGEFVPSIALNGRGYDLTTPGGIVTEELGIFTLLALPALGIHIAIRLTRAIEDSGRLELLTAGRVSRSAPTVAGMLLGLTAIAVLYLTFTASLIAIDLPPSGAIRYSAVMAGLTAAHMAVGWLCAQMSRDARTSYSAAVTAALVFYLARLVIDVRGWDATWVSPSSWAAEAQPWAESSPLWPFIAYLVMTALGFVASWAISARRDLGGGVLAPRPGPARASASLSGPWGLAWRLVRGGAFGWTAGIGAMALACGLIAEEMSDLTENNPQLTAALGSGLDALASLILLLVSIVAAAAGLQSVGTLVGEETPGRVGLILAAPIARPRWWIAVTAIAVGQVLVTTAVGTAALAGSMAWALDDSSWWATCFEAAAALTPAALVIVMLTLMAGSVTPTARHAGWVLLTWSFVATVFADLLDLPRWVAALSPWDWVGRVPVDSPEWWTIALLAAVALTLALASTMTFWRRELRAG